MVDPYNRRDRLMDAIAKGYITDPNSSDFEGGIGTSTDSESLFPTPPKAPSKKQTGATGASGPTGPAPKTPTQAPQQNRDVFADSPAASALRNQHLNTAGDTRADQISGHAEAIQNHFEGPPQMTHYHWFAGTGGLQGGNDAGMRADFSDGTSRWINTSIPGQIPQAPPTTLEAQQKMLADASVPGGGGGILPGWNSPTGQNIDLTKFGPKEVDISAAGPTPPSGWLNSAIAAARSGANTYDTGGVKSEGNSPRAEIEQGNPFNQTKIATPTGGSIGVNTGAGNNDNPFVGDRANLVGGDNLAIARKLTSANMARLASGGAQFDYDRRQEEY